MYHIYEALELTPYEEVKVVILGQDPYHGEKIKLMDYLFLCNPA